MAPEPIEDSPNQSQTSPHSYLFMVRVRAEALGQGQWEWRGQVQHLLTGETRYFRDWPTLVTFLQVWLEAESEQTPK